MGEESSGDCFEGRVGLQLLILFDDLVVFLSVFKVLGGVHLYDLQDLVIEILRVIDKFFMIYLGVYLKDLEYALLNELLFILSEYLSIMVGP